VWPIGTRVDLDRQYLRPSPRHHFHGGNQLWRNAIGNQVGEALFFRQHIADALDLTETRR
jgi:hypothetical protein